ncbi:MAG: polysaccharide biosynthesis/export family protein [Desulfuromonas sp.]|nr:polysaccharide biosynthesis/export family protein [Desulfuromonas sp.]
MNKYLISLLSLLYLISVPGCVTLQPTGQATTDPPKTPVADNTVAQASSEPEENREYVLQEGDIVEIKLFYNPELNEAVTIRPDGKISLQLVDELIAVGLTPAGLDRVLTEKYSKLLLRPEVAVIVREFSSQKIFVGGEVKDPGLFPATNRLTVLQAIFQAGGYTNTAELTNVVVLRNQGSDKPLFMKLNLIEDLTDPGKNNDFLLKPCDVVFVPMTRIGRLNQFVDQYIEKLIPISKHFGFTYVYELNPSK